MSDTMIRWLYGLQHFGIKLGLDNIRALLADLEHPQSGLVTALVAGTNGKGSVSAILDSLLAAHGVTAGMFTSPHLMRPNERIRIAGKDIGDEELERRLAGMRERIERAVDSGELEAHPSFFEVVTATALEAFRDHELRAAILEVGLGGRLDATNAVDADVPVIVSIGLDHTKTLGPTIEKIAFEKAGVIKAGRPVVSGVVQQSAIDVLQKVCRERDATLLDARSRVLLVRENDDTFDLVGTAGEYRKLRISLPGRHQIDNSRIAVAAFELLAARLGVDVEPGAVREGFASVRWAGRLQWVDPGDGGPRLLFDGAHNPAGVDALVTYLSRLDTRPSTILFGATRGKPLDRLLGPLARFASRIVITRPPVEKGLDPDDVAQIAAPMFEHVESVQDPAAALARARSSADGGWVLVTGSLYLVGDILGLLSRESVPGPVSM